jgi:glycosyltransferase involved in cell wall biosynthesis
MDNSMPLLTIGLPVRNGQRFLAEVLESVFKQEFADFRLVISDNASTDGTQSICEAAVARDTRVSYSRLESVLSISENFNRVANNVKTKYFKWIADDDLMDPAFFGECVSALEEDPGAVLAYPQSIEIDETGALLGESWKPRHQSDSDRVCRRFRHDPNRLVAPHARLLRELLAAVGRSTLPALPCCQALLGNGITSPSA